MTIRAFGFRRGALRTLAVPAAVLALVLAGCGTTSTGSPHSTPPDGSAITTTVTPTIPAPTTSTTSTHHHRQAAWAPDLGPIDPNNPPDETLYAFVAPVRNCAKLVSAEHDPNTESDYTAKVYAGLGHACKGEWAAAAADARAANQDAVPSDAGTCFVKVAGAALNRLVQAYQEGGGQPLDLVNGPRSTQCSQPSSSGPSSPSGSTPSGPSGSSPSSPSSPSISGPSNPSSS